MEEKLKDISQEYIILCFSLDNIIGKGQVVDSYVGDFDVEKVQLINDTSLLTDKIESLMARLDGFSSENQNEVFIDLKSSVNSLYHLSVSLFNPDKDDFASQIENIYHIPLALPDDHEIKVLKSNITSCLSQLGYTDKWPICYEKWHEDNTVSGEEYYSHLIDYSEQLQELTFENIVKPIIGYMEAESLLEESSVNYELVDTKELWNAYHYYYKGFKSVVKINKNNTFNKHEAFFLAAHEIFPGHHTEAIIKEFLYRKAELGIASTINILSSPSTLISEGIADYGYYFFGKDYTLDQKITHDHRRLTKTARHKTAIQIINNEIGEDEGISLLSESIGIGEKGAEKAIRFATEKWRLYFPCYYMGYKTVSDIYKKAGSQCLAKLYKFSSMELINQPKDE